MNITASAQAQPRPEIPPGMIKLGGHPSTLPYLRSIWSRRSFATAVPAGELRAQNMDTVLGNLWHLLNPAFLVAVYFFVFGVLLGTNRGVDNFLLFLSIGIVIFGYASKTAIAGSQAIVSNEGLIRSIPFPRAILPISTVVGQTLALFPAIAVLLFLAVVTGEPPTLQWLGLIPALGLLALFNLGTAFIVSSLTDSFRDIANLLPYVFRILFYVSGVMFSVEEFVSNPFYRRVFDFNPFYAFITLARHAIFSTSMRPDLWLIVGGWTSLLLVGGFYFFKAREHRYGRG